MIDLIKQVFNKNFLFTQSSSSDLHTLLPWIIVFAGVIILAILTSLFFAKIDPVKARIRSKITTWLLSVGLVGYVVVFFRSQQLGIMSKNIFIMSVFAVWLVWLLAILQFIIFKYPKMKEAFLERERIRKYLPKTKKKNRK